jgi:hypothetical protein
MKTYKYYLFAACMLFSLKCAAQATQGTLEIIKSMNYYYVNDKKVCMLNYTLINESDSTYLFWIESDREILQKSESEIVEKYFYAMHGDWNLSQLALDFNVENYTIDVFLNFLKYLKPSESFTIQVISTEDVSESKKSEIFNYIDAHMVLIKESTLNHYVKVINSFNPIIFYPNSFIVLPIEMCSANNAEKSKKQFNE